MSKRAAKPHLVWRLRVLAGAVMCAFMLGTFALGCVGANQDPKIAYIPDLTVAVSEGVRLTVTANDPDGDPVTFTIEGLPEEAQVIPMSPSEMLLFWNPSITDTGPGGRRYDVTIAADDGRGGTGSTSFVLWGVAQGGAPIFDLPSGVVVNLADKSDVALPVAVKDVDSATVQIYMVEAPQGAKFEMAEGKLGTFFWQPTETQRATTVHRAVFSAQDESHDPVTHTLMIVLLNAEDDVGCATTPPSVLHTFPGDLTYQADDKNKGAPIATEVHDNESAVSSVSLYWRTGPVDGPFSQLKMEGVEDSPGDWSAWVPVQNVGNQGVLLHYYFIATDNDDPFGVDCDRESRLPKGGVFSVGVGPQGASPTLCVDDEWAGNDSLQTAKWVEVGAQYGMRLCGTKSDWVQISATEGEPLKVTVETTQSVTAPSLVTLKLVTADGAVLDEVTGTDTLRVETVPTSGAALYAQVTAMQASARISYAWKVSQGDADCPSEPFEPNNSVGQATPLGAAPHEGLSLCPGDEDYFAIQVSGGKQVRVVLAFDHLYGDLDLDLLAGDGKTLLAIGSTKTSSEVVVYTPETSGTIYARVYGYEDATNTYGIALTEQDPNAECKEDPLAPNQTPEEAAVIYQGVYEGFQLCPSTGDWFAVDLNGGETFDVIVEPTLTLGLNVHIYSDPQGTALASAALDASGWAWATLENVPPGRLYYRVSGGLVPLEYTLLQEVTDPPGDCSPDRLEPNNHPTEATAIEEGVVTWARLCAGDQDFYAIQVPPFTTLTALTYHGWGAGWADLEIRDANGNVLGGGMDYGQGADVQVLVEDEGVVYVVVTGEANVTVSYDLGVFLD